jgi:hypothetical protein
MEFVYRISEERGSIHLAGYHALPHRTVMLSEGRNWECVALRDGLPNRRIT